MARKIKNFEPPKGGGGRNPTYPWDKWFDGNTWELVQGKDFTASVTSMQKFIREVARHRQVAVSVFKTNLDRLVITTRSNSAAG